MDTLYANFVVTLDSYVREYIKKVASKHHIVENELLQEWEEYAKVETKAETKVQTKVDTKVQTKADTKKVENKTTGCPYVFSKGEKSGKMCGSKSKNGSLYCSLHKKHEDKEPKQAKLPEPKSKVDTSKHLFIKNVVLGKPVHKDTGLVIRSSEDRTVIGKCVNNSLNKLESDDVETCKKLGYNYCFIDLEDEPNHIESKTITEEPATVTKPVTKPATVTKPIVTKTTTVTKPVTKTTTVTKPITKPVTKLIESVNKVTKGVENKTATLKVFKPEPKVEKEDTEEELMEAVQDEVDKVNEVDKVSQTVKKSEIEEDTHDEEENEVNLIDEEDETNIVKKAFGL